MRALVLSGGAAKGAYQVGILKHLLGDLGKQYDLICGVSVGAINASYLAMFQHGEEKKCIENLELLWRGLTTDNIYVSWVNLPWILSYLGYLVAPFKSSVFNSKPLEELVAEHYNQDLIATSGKMLRVGAVSMNTREYKVFGENHPDIVKAILASSAFPMFFCPIEIDGEFWLDGGIREVTPLKAAIDAGADEIDIIMTSPPNGDKVEYEDAPKLLSLGPRILNIMSEEIIDTDVDRAFEINNLIKNGANVPGKRYIPMTLFRPEEPLTEDSLKFEQEFIDPMIKIGYEQAKLITGL